MARIEIIPYQDRWPAEFAAVAAALRGSFGPLALAIHHIGSTAVPGLAAKDVIDAQVSLAALDPLAPIRAAVEGAGFRVRDDYGAVHDHTPPGADPTPANWAKRRAAAPEGAKRVHVHLRVRGRPNARYPLLFRDYLRATPAAREAYAQIKRALAARHPDNADAYYDVKDPVMDLVVGAAELWARGAGWTLPPSDA